MHLVDIEVDEVSLVDRPANKRKFVIVKRDVAKAEADDKAKVEAEAKAKADEKAKLEAEAKTKADEEARLKAEAEAKEEQEICSSLAKITAELKATRELLKV